MIAYKSVITLLQRKLMLYNNVLYCDAILYRYDAIRYR